MSDETKLMYKKFVDQLPYFFKLKETGEKMWSQPEYITHLQEQGLYDQKEKPKLVKHHSELQSSAFLSTARPL